MKTLKENSELKNLQWGKMQNDAPQMGYCEKSIHCIIYDYSAIIIYDKLHH